MKLHPSQRLLPIALLAMTAVGCTVRDQPNYLIAPQINHMVFSKTQESQGKMYSPKYNPTLTDRDEVADGVIMLAHGEGRTLLVPPEGTIRRCFNAMHYDVTAEGAKAAGLVDDKGEAKLTDFAIVQAKKAGEELTNPYAGKAEGEVMQRAEAVYTTFCSPCHGVTGMGDGPVSKLGVPGFPLAPASSPPAGFKDGHIYQIMTYGRGMMSSYATQITQDDRWKAILWVRELQKRAAAGAQGGQ